jgi:hypothetical protein
MCHKEFVYAAAKKHELRDDPRCDNAKIVMETLAKL